MWKRAAFDLYFGINAFCFDSTNIGIFKEENVKWYLGVKVNLGCYLDMTEYLGTQQYSNML